MAGSTAAAVVRVSRGVRIVRRVAASVVARVSWVAHYLVPPTRSHARLRGSKTAATVDGSVERLKGLDGTVRQQDDELDGSA